MAIESWLDSLKIDFNKAYELAIISKLSYLRKTDNTIDTLAVLTELQKLDDRFYSVIPFNNKSSQGIFVRHPEYNTVVFSGTDEISDWLDNARIKKVKRLDGKIHRGFNQALEDLWGGIFAFWGSLPQDCKDLPLYLGGHSLGGAMATIAIVRFFESGIPVTQCYTFGQPKIGDSPFATSFNNLYQNKLYRFHNDSDIVPLLPSFLFGYVDCGANLYLNNKGELHYDRNVSFGEQVIKHIIATAHDLFNLHPGWLKDHEINKYIEAIDKLKKQK